MPSSGLADEALRLREYSPAFDWESGPGAGPAHFERPPGRIVTDIVADHQYVIGTGSFDPATDDAATAGVNSAHLSAFHQHLAHDLGYRSDLH